MCIPARIEPRDVGAAHLCFVVDDLPAAYEQLREAGVDSFVSPPVQVDTGINTGGYGLYLRDPDGILVELFQPPADGRRDERRCATAGATAQPCSTCSAG